MTTGDGLAAFLASAPAAANHRPWPRHELTLAHWRRLIERLATSDWAVLAVWGEAGKVHATLRDEVESDIAVVSLACPGGSYPALGAVRPGAIRMERALADLVGLTPEGASDVRPWLDHGRWPLRRPLSARPETRTLAELIGPDSADRPPAAASDYPFLPVEGKGVHQIPVGPVHAGIIEPGHFRFHAYGETVVRLEERLGYAHKGVEWLMQGRTPVEAARLAARISGDSTVAHSLAFARAVEAALGVSAPPRADALRAVMAELERIANHLGDIGAICNDASFTFLHAQMNVLRETVLRAADRAFGHRLMMDRVAPGGTTVDLSASAAEALAALPAEIGPRFDRLIEVYDRKPSLLDRTVGTGVVDAGLAHRFAAGGFIGRASSRGFDARRSPGYPPYNALDFEVPVMAEGDVNARLMVRAEEIRASLALVGGLLGSTPGGPVMAALPSAGGEGMAIVEGFRGDIVTWVRLRDDATVDRCHPRDPSWLQWPLLEAAIAGNIVADFPLCNKSFNCSYSGHDL